MVDINNNDVLNNFMVSEDKEKKTDLDSLKELFNKENIVTKTELTKEQIILVNQKRVIADLLGWTTLNYAIDDFMCLMISKDRSGRREFVDGFKGNRDREENMGGGGFFGNIKDKLGMK